ncbi:MAG TPA: hypothetical protein VE977_10610 [Pyrinomonadaceae bacterium]|nr:hypothetical protein [Pyrinomonadaceae bacterium]
MRNYLLFISIFALSAFVTQPGGRSQFFSATEALAAGSDDHGGEIVSKYDGFNHETVVTLKKMKVTCAKPHENLKQTCVSILATLHCPGVQLDYVHHVTLQVVFETKDWDQRHPLDQRDLSMVADGETFRLGRMQLAALHTDVLMTETLQGELPYNTFKKIALAEIVEIQVGKSRFELRSNNLAALRDLNNRIKFSRRS